MATQINSLMPEELVAMLLVIYLQKSWKPESKKTRPTWSGIIVSIFVLRKWWYATLETTTAGHNPN